MTKETLNTTVSNNKTNTNSITKGTKIMKKTTSTTEAELNVNAAITKNKSKLSDTKAKAEKTQAEKTALELITHHNANVVADKKIVSEANKRIDINLVSIFNIVTKSIKEEQAKEANKDKSKRQIISYLQSELDKKVLDIDTKKAYSIAYTFTSAKIEMKDKSINFKQLMRLEYLYNLANKREMEYTYNKIKYTVENPFFMKCTKNGISNSLSLSEYIKEKNKFLKEEKSKIETEISNNTAKIITKAVA